MKRRRAGLGVVQVRVDRDRVAEMRERPEFYKKAAGEVVKAACRVVKRGDAFGGRRVFISDVAAEVGLPVKRLAPLLATWQRLGWVELVRADFRGAMDPAKVDASEIDNGVSRFNFVAVDPKRDC